MDFTKPVALVIGVNRYKEYRSLKGAKEDAEDVGDWLMNTGAAPEKNITRLLSMPNDEDPYVPISNQVHDWLDTLDQQAEARKGKAFPLGQRVYVMFAGHGYNATTGAQTAIFPPTSKTRWDLIPIVPLKNYLTLSGYFREVVILSDACRDAIDFAPDTIFPRKMDTSANAALVKSFEVYAARAGAKAKEKEFKPGKYRGIMTQAFLRGVSGAARDSQGNVTTEKLKNFIKSAVIAELDENHKPEIIESDDFIICTAPEVWCRLKITPVKMTQGTATLKHHVGNVVKDIDLGKGEQVVEIPIGAHTLTTPDGTETIITAIWEEQNVTV